MVGTMPVKTACPHCSARLVLKHDHAPAQVKCPKCHERLHSEPIMTFYLLRQMEFDADRYEAEVAGSAQFARTIERLSELDVAFNNVLLSALRGTLTTESEMSFAQQVIEEAGRLSERDQRQVAKAMAPKRAKWFDSHPSPTERIAAVARRPHPGIFQLEGPALCLLNTSALAREAGRRPTPG